MLTRHTHKQLLWIELKTPNKEEAQSVAKEFDVHPLAIAELLAPSTRQKTDRYGDFLYLVLHLPSFSRGGAYLEQEIDLIIGRRVIITATYDHIPALQAFAQTFETSSELDKDVLGSQTGHVAYLMLRQFYRTLFEEMESVRDELVAIEEMVFHGQEKRMVSNISRASRAIFDFRRSLSPHKEILESLESAGSRTFGEEFGFYVRLLEGEQAKARSALDELRESLQELRETNNSLLSTKQNEIMQTLTVIAFIFLPLSFISGLFQMNAVSTPLIGRPDAFWLILALMVFLGSCFYGYSKYKRWL